MLRYSIIKGQPYSTPPRKNLSGRQAFTASAVRAGFIQQPRRMKRPSGAMVGTVYSKRNVSQPLVVIGHGNGLRGLKKERRHAYVPAMGIVTCVEVALLDGNPVFPESSGEVFCDRSGVIRCHQEFALSVFCVPHIDRKAPRNILSTWLLPPRPNLDLTLSFVTRDVSVSDSNDIRHLCELIVYFL